MLAPLSVLYGGIIRGRNCYYDRTRSASHPAGVPVISVGNLTVGGTGKTPLVIEIVRHLLSGGRKPAIVTRGYAAAAGQTADEVLEFHAALPDVPVLVNPDRVAGAHAAVAQHHADCVVLDDGFQHRRLRRDLDVVVIDALNPWGGGWLLPAGRLREPLSSLGRAHAIIISRVNQISESAVDDIVAETRRCAPQAALFRATAEIERLVDLFGEPRSPDELRQRHVLPACGIGNPRSFERLVEGCTAQSQRCVTFADHHRFRPADVGAIAASAAERGANLVVTTRKDWVKLAPLWKRAAAERTLPELWRLDMRLRVQDREGFRRLLASVLPKAAEVHAKEGA